MNKEDDIELKAFLKRCRPIAPEAPQREFNAIMAKIDAKGHKRRISFWWHIAVPVAVAACLTLFIVADFDNEPGTNVASIDDVALEDFLVESYAVVDNGNSDLSIGDDWLQLAL